MRKYGVSIVIILLILFATNFCVKNIWEIINLHIPEHTRSVFRGCSQQPEGLK